MDITFPTDTKSIIDAIRGAIGRDILFLVPSGTACSGCTLDPVTNFSTNSFCPICSGEYWIKTWTEVVASGHITWGPTDFNNWQTGGQLFEGDCRIQIEYSAENLSLLEATSYIVVDGKEVEIKNNTPRGVKELNRIILKGRERKKEHE